MRHELGTGLYAGLLFTVLGLVAWATGVPFVFPSLGPSAFVLAHDRRGEGITAYRVVGSHAIGVFAGLFAYTLIGQGTVLTQIPPATSAGGARLAASGVLSVTFTTWGMLLSDTRHAPACATTLIVSLGLLSTPVEAATIVASVAILFASHWTVLRAVEGLLGEELG